jgi:hypothetical protein
MSITFNFQDISDAIAFDLKPSGKYLMEIYTPLVEACDNEIFILHGVLDRNWKNIG